MDFLYASSSVTQFIFFTHQPLSPLSGLAITGKTGGLGATGAMVWFWARVVYRVLQGNVKKCRELIDFSPCCVLRDRIVERVKGDFSSRGDVIVHHVIVYFFYLVLNIT